MNSRFVFWSSVLILCLVLSGLCLRGLATAGISFSESLVTRGLACLIVVIAFARGSGQSLRPKRPMVQAGRAVLAGLALTFFFMSYQWLTATAVSVLSNIDVPLLVVLGPLVGLKTSWRKRGLALVAISFLVWFVLSLEAQTHLAYGLSSLFLGTVLLCFGYLFIQKSMTEENQAVTILVPSLALIAYGLAQSFTGAATGASWTPSLASVAALSGVSMFGAYYATMRLYEQADLATAEFPTLVASVVIQPFEALFLGEPMRFTYVVSSIGFVLVIFVLVTYQNRELVADA